MRTNRNAFPIQLTMFSASPAAPPLPANVSSRLLILLVKLLRGAACQRVQEGDHE
jgi:hypothetical protein